jgi:ATP-binding cassette subfamily F protein 2
MGKKSARAIAAAKKKAEAKKGKGGGSKEPETSNSSKSNTSDKYPWIHCTGILESSQTDRDVKFGAFALSSHGTELIKDTSLELTIGRRYGLIGSNGSGKSTLLKCLASRAVPVPEFIDLYYLEEEAQPSSKTALETIVDRANDEVKRLDNLAEQILDEEGPDSERLVTVYEKLESMDPQTFEVRAGKLLHGLGFSKAMSRKATKDMSGGWRMRVSLAEALFVRPTLLLLDEPTNHLDLEACVWLERYLADYPYCLFVVSHSQDFLNGVCTNIMEITETKQLKIYSGNYDQYIQTKKELEVNQMKKYQKEQDDIKHIKQFIASCGTFSNLVKQAKSKQKILDKMYAAGLTPPVQAPPKFSFLFSECEKLPPPVLAFNNVAFSYSGLQKDYLYKGLNLGVDLDSRIALVGPNGAGKSTLLKLMINEESPTEGTVKRHIHLAIGRYHQHSNDQLDGDMQVLEFVIKSFQDKIQMEEEDWRKAIGRFGISGALQKAKIGTLSDGLKSRIVFAMLALEKPNMLLLDEPTNHLDMACIDALAEAINSFTGGVVLVSHDFRLIDQVAKELWVCDKKTVTKWRGDIRSYKDSLAKGMKF